ncbi:MAG: hypothetical protein AAGB05_09865 [Pseudomonadota bacterium]
MTPQDAAFLATFDRLPWGTVFARFGGRRWVVTRSGFVSGRAEKRVGNALDGSDDVSLNLYRLARGIRLAPCAMSEAKVRAFVRGLNVTPEA